MKIVFLGTPEFAVPSLEILLKNGFEIAAVVTAQGKKAGRGLQIKQPAIKLFADLHNIKTLQPEKLTDPVFIEELRNLKADLFIVVAFRMLPELVWTMPPLGTFNLHSSLLPQYRGAAPINRVIMNGETETGVTTFFLKHEIDTGNIIFREKISIHPDETAGELHDRLKFKGAELVLKTVNAITDGKVKQISQDELNSDKSPLKTAPKIFASDCAINWTRKKSEIHNQIRGLSPFPGAFTIMQDDNGNRLQFKIFKSQHSLMLKENLPGTLEIADSRLFIYCGDGLLEILELQQEGKKKMAVHDFLMGFRKEKNWKCIAVN